MAKKQIGRVFGLVWLMLTLLAPTGAFGQDRGHIDVLQIDGAVTPIMLSYIERGIRVAGEDGAAALVVQLNTPGGGIDLMSKIVQVLLSSDVPVVVYVYPSGSYAASAGTLITLAGHVAAMAPGTTIGAASPVGSEGEDLGETMEAKVKEDLSAQARALTKRRGEKAMAWAESAIREAKAATAEEALGLGVIDFIAGDLDELVAKLDGFAITINGREAVLSTEGATSQEVPMNFAEQFLHIITNPTVAYILLTLGINAILYELSSPGGYVAGIVGVVCLVLSFYALGVLPVNYAGLLFIGLAFILFIVDIKAPTHGALTVGGIVSLVAGGLILFNSPLYRVSIAAVVGVATATGLFFAFAVAKAVRAQRNPITTGREALAGQVAEAQTDLGPEGTVFLKGELWDAVADGGPIEKGAAVRVTAVEGFRLRVRKIDAQETLGVPRAPRARD